MVSFPLISPARPYTPPSPRPYAPHAQPMLQCLKMLIYVFFVLLEISVNCAALIWQIVYLCRDDGILLPRRIPSRLQLSLVTPKSAR